MKDRLYRLLSGEGEQRVCEAIPEEACREVPRNASLNILNGACTKLAEQLAGPGLVLAWLFSFLGAPPVMAGWLEPTRQAASLLPQLAVAARIRRLQRRKWAWVAAGTTQGILLLLMIPVVLFLSGAGAAALILVLLALFSMASGVGSVAFQDVAAKTISKRRRGRLLGRRALLGGILTIVAGIALRRWVGEDAGAEVYAILIACAGVLWIAGAGFFALITETPGATGGGRNAFSEMRRGMELLRSNRTYGHYLRVRGLMLLGVELALPFYTLHAVRYAGQGGSRLGIFLLTSGLAAALSSAFWGRFADKSSRTVMAVGSLMGFAAAGCALIFTLLPELWRSPWLYAPVFFLAGLSIGGVRTGRKIYLIDGAPDSERPTYVAFANTLMGVVTLSGGLLGLAGQWLGPDAQVALIGVLALAGALAAITLKPPEALG